MSSLEQVYEQFDSDVRRAEHLLTLISGFREFGASTSPNGDQDEVLWPEAQALYGQSREKRTDLPVLSGSLQLYLAGRFEYCIRQVVEVVADEIGSRVCDYSGLPEQIRKELKAKTLEIAQNPARYGYDDSQAEALLSAYMLSKSTNGRPVAIDSSVLSLTDSNMKDRVLADVLKRIGMQEVWVGIGKQATMKLELEKSSDGEATKEAQVRLNSIMDERNQVAHPTSNTVFPDPDQVAKTARFLRVLARTIIDLAKVYLTSYPKPTG